MPRLLAPSISSTSTSSPVADALADVALRCRGSGVGPCLAVERLGQDPGRRGLAHAPGTGEQVGVAHAVGGDRVRQGLGDVLLADQVLEDLRPVRGRRRRTAPGRVRQATSGELGDESDMRSRRGTDQAILGEVWQPSPAPDERPATHEETAYGC